MTTSIERIREQVARVREEHCNGRPNLAAEVGYCNGCVRAGAAPTSWPCPTIKLAENNLKLAEALEQSQLALDHLWAAVGDRLLAKGPLSREYANSTSTRVRQASESAERILAEVAE